MSEDKQVPPPKSGLSPSTGLRRAQSSRSGLAAFWAELKRRKVMRVAITYAVVAWLIIQIAEATFENFGIPVWAFRFVTLMVLLGFPIAIILAWAFELTPEGIKTTRKAVADRGDAPVSEKQQRKRNWTAYAVGAALPTVIFGALALFFYIRSGNVTQEDDGEKSIAVLPLENLSPDPENAFFADGVQEDILFNLSRVDDLRVISRTSTLVYKDTPKQTKDIGEELGVRYLVEGSLRRAGKQVRISVQLINAEMDQQIWSGNFNRTLDDIFELQAEVAKEIAGQLHAILTPEEIEKINYRPTESQEAWDFYVRARQMIEAGMHNWDERIEILEQAVALDPDFAEAWAQLAVESVRSWRYAYFRNSPEHLAKAHHAIKQAERAGPGLPDIPFAQAILVRDEQVNIEGYVELLQEALDRDPKFEFALGHLAYGYFCLNRLVESQETWEIRNRIDPLSLRSNIYLTHSYQLSGSWDRSRALIQQNLKRPGDLRFWQIMEAEADYLEGGDREAFLANLERLPELPETPYFVADKALRMALLKRDYPVALSQLQKMDPEGAYPLLYYTMDAEVFRIESTGLLEALLWFELGEQEKAILAAREAKDYLESVVEGDPVGPRMRANLAICYAILGDRERLNSSVTKVREITRTIAWQYRDQATSELYLAMAYLGMEDEEQALDILEAASEMESRFFLNRELDLWFIFDRLRGNPRFEALLED